LHAVSVLALVGQVPRPAVGAPEVTVQCPTCPALLHDWHGLLGSHDESQHTPSTQLPDAHCDDAVHA
jgi:hypothetical protein